MANSTQIGGSKVNTVEIVRWKSLPEVSDADMKLACRALVPDLRTISGFVDKTLYKDGTDWVDIYVWETQEDAATSTQKMVEKDSFKNLMRLVDPASISISILQNTT
jgi:hypothetical protein